MSKASQTETENIATNFLNQAAQTIQNYCSIACGNDIENANIVVTGDNVTINLSQTCSAVGSECTIKNLMSSQIDNLITNMVKNQESNEGIFSLLGPSSTESTYITNNIKNQISQLVNNSCNLSSENTINGIHGVFAGNNDVFNITQSGNMDKAMCALDTVVKSIMSNTANNTVTDTESSCGFLKYLVIALAIIALIILLPIIKNILPGSSGGVLPGKGGGSSINVAPPSVNVTNVVPKPSL